MATVEIVALTRNLCSIEAKIPTRKRKPTRQVVHVHRFERAVLLRAWLNSALIRTTGLVGAFVIGTVLLPAWISLAVRVVTRKWCRTIVFAVARYITGREARRRGSRDITTVAVGCSQSKEISRIYKAVVETEGGCARQTYPLNS